MRLLVPTEQEIKSAAREFALSSGSQLATDMRERAVQLFPRCHAARQAFIARTAATLQAALGIVALAAEADATGGHG